MSINKGWRVVVLIKLHRGAYNDCEIFWTERVAKLRKEQLIKDGIDSYELIIETKVMPIEANLCTQRSTHIKEKERIIRERNEEFDKYPRLGNANLSYND